MIVWINGAFGAGKTTVAEALAESVPEVRLFDPEHVGFLLRRFVPMPTGDFQDLPLWRELVVAHLRGPAGTIRWRHQHVAMALAELSGLADREPDPLEIDNVGRSPAAVAAGIAEQLGLLAPDRPGT